MIVLLHPRSTRPKNRRFPLAILSVAAVLEGREDYVIIDGNLDPDPAATLDRAMREKGVELLAVSVMPGPQMVAAISLCRDFRRKHPGVPIVWGGYFPSVYPEAALNADYVDLVVRGQGEDTFLEIIGAERGKINPTAISPHFQFDFGIPTLQRPSASLFIGVQALSGRTEANTQWVKKKTSRFSSPSTDF